MSCATRDIVLLRQLFAEVGQSLTEPTVIHEVNQQAVSLTKNPVSHARTKHIDIRYHSALEKVENGVFMLKYTPTKEMVADIFIKSLQNFQFVKFWQALGMDLLDF